MIQPTMTFEPPREYTINNVCFWEPESKQLLYAKRMGDRSSSAILSKAKKFLEANCIIKENNDWVCKALRGYNKTTYKLTFENNDWVCECQGFQAKIAKGEKPICSHILALKQKLFLISKEEEQCQTQI